MQVQESTAKKTQSGTWLVLAGIMLATFLAALDSSVVSTAMPTITGILGGFGLYSWVFSLYLLTSTVTVPIWGKLADLYGRKRILILGIVIFIVGSALCGSAHSMLQLVIYRGIQGIGSGAVLPVATTIPGDLFSIEQRARIQGWIGSVWGVAAVVGPALGGLIVDHFTWQWVFYINVPFAMLAVLLLAIYFKEDVQARPHGIDYIGAVTLMAGTSLLLLGLTSSGKQWSWFGPQSAAVFGLAIVLLLIFLFVERRVREPILPLSLFRSRFIAVAGIASLLFGGVMMGVTTYVPLFAQGAVGTTATVAGAVVATMSIGWTLAGTICGRVILRWGYRRTSILGGVFLLVGVAMLVIVTRNASPFYVALCSFVVGLGMGFSTTAFVVGIQSQVTWEQRGTATASNMFIRSLGGTIWVAVLGTVVNTIVLSHTRSIARSSSTTRDPSSLINSLLNPSGTAHVSSAVVEQVRGALASAFHSLTFWEIAVAALALLVLLWMPSSNRPSTER